jgi:GNAT superfamily N-acetyltransferase
MPQNALPGSGRGRQGWGVIEIRDLELDDERILREYFGVEQAAQRADRPDAVLRKWPQLQQMLLRPSPYHARHSLVAREDGRVVGTAELAMPQQDNPHLAGLEVNVLPTMRRRGIGRALHDEAVRRVRAERRTTVLGETFRPVDGETSAGLAFARALGFEVVHQEDHQALRLPLPNAQLAGLPTGVEGYELITWGQRCPDDLVQAYAEMHTRMGQDAPSGDIDFEPATIDVTRIREGEERTAEAYAQIVAAARRTSDGVFGGYTLVYLPHGDDYVVQDDTLVMPDHRGHGLGMALKAKVLRLLAEHHPDRRVVHTWNGTGNEPMLRINRELGFRPVERELEVQRKLADA